jgi:hypothetical protein
MIEQTKVFGMPVKQFASDPKDQGKILKLNFDMPSERTAKSRNIRLTSLLQG